MNKKIVYSGDEEETGNRNRTKSLVLMKWNIRQNGFKHDQKDAQDDDDTIHEELSSRSKNKRRRNVLIYLCKQNMIQCF